MDNLEVLNIQAVVQPKDRFIIERLVIPLLEYNSVAVDYEIDGSSNKAKRLLKRIVGIPDTKAG